MKKHNEIAIKNTYLDSFADFYGEKLNSFYIIISPDGNVLQYSENSLFLFQNKISAGKYHIQKIITSTVWNRIKAEIDNKNFDMNIDVPIAQKEWNIEICSNQDEYFLLLFTQKRENIVEVVNNQYIKMVDSFNFPVVYSDDNNRIVFNKRYSQVFGINRIESIDDLIAELKSNTLGSEPEDTNNGIIARIKRGDEIYAVYRSQPGSDSSLLSFTRENNNFTDTQNPGYKEDVTIHSVISSEEKEVYESKLKNYENTIIQLESRLSLVEKELVANLGKVDEVKSYTEKVDEETIVDEIESMQGEYAHFISRTSETLTKMSELSGFIEDISTKIHLISINAGIESARVGEAGKGFAVISREIAKLSDSTQTYSNMITNEIESIVKVTGNITYQDNTRINSIKDNIGKVFERHNKIINIHDTLKKIL